MPRPRARMSILGSSVRSSVGGISPALARAVLPAALAFGALALVVGFPVLSANPSALWNIVHEKCEPHWLAANDPAPCARVDMRGGADGGVAILKDLVGVAQYLAIPTRRISGTESPILLAPDAPDLFAAAWSARQFTFERLGKELPRDGIGLAINSALSRSQDQAHIHVDCLRLDIRAELARLAPHIAAGWSPEAVVLDGKPYRVLRIDGPELNGVNPFRLVAEGLSEARDNMGGVTIVVVGTTFEGPALGFLVLVGIADLAKGDRAHGEDLQDHSCAIAKDGLQVLR